MSRDRFEQEISCPNCGQQGILKTSEADGWEWMKESQKLGPGEPHALYIESLTKGFRDLGLVVKTIPDPNSTSREFSYFIVKISCGQCKTEFNSG